jgi:hypothetical protein
MADLIFADVDFAASGIEGCGNRALLTAGGGHNFQQGNGHDWLVQDFGQCLNRGQAYP